MYKKLDIKLALETNEGALVVLEVQHGNFLKPIFPCGESNHIVDIFPIGKRKHVEALIKDLTDVLDSPWIQE